MCAVRAAREPLATHTVGGERARTRRDEASHRRVARRDQSRPAWRDRHVAGDLARLPPRDRAQHKPDATEQEGRAQLARAAQSTRDAQERDRVLCETAARDLQGERRSLRNENPVQESQSERDQLRAEYVTAECE